MLLTIKCSYWISWLHCKHHYSFLKSAQSCKQIKSAACRKCENLPQSKRKLWRDVALTGVGKVKGSEERVVVFGSHSGVWRVKKNTISPEQLLNLLLQLLLLLDEEVRGFGRTFHLKQGQPCKRTDVSHILLCHWNSYSFKTAANCRG